MTLKVYNTLTRKKEDFVTIKNNLVSMYSCGPTVYSYAHIGNLRTYVFMDLIRRVFKYNGYKIKGSDANCVRAFLLPILKKVF